MQVVYRLFDSTDQLLYVGRTGSNLHERLSNHASRRWWPEVSYCRLEFPADAKAAKIVE